MEDWELQLIEDATKRKVDVISEPEYRMENVDSSEGRFRAPQTYHRVKFRGGKKWHLIKRDK